MHHPLRTLLVLALAAAPALAKPPPPANPNAGPTVNLPQTMVDSAGNNWMIYQQGWLQMQGNNPIYGQSAQLTINGNQPNGRGAGNRARLDEKTGELLFDFNNNGINITRRVLLNKKDGYVRYVDVFKNARPHDQSLNVQLTSNLNFGVNAAEVVADPRNREKNLAWVAQTDGPSCAVEVYASRNARLTPTIDWQPGNNTVTATYQLPVPTGKSAAILHIHALSPTTDAGIAYVQSMKESKVIADLPLDLRKQLVNFSAPTGLAGDFEVLRGDTLDVVELRPTGAAAGGAPDQYKGTLQEPSYKLQTFYGTLSLPADRVVGLINVGDFRPRQLLITTEGEIFGGHLLPSTQSTPGQSAGSGSDRSAAPDSSSPTIHLRLSSGQLTQIPLTQISRIGYRKRPGEPEEWTLTKPMVLLRTGDRVQTDLPSNPISVSTRYGHLSLAPQSISSLVLSSEDHGVHEILLTDGSQFAGLVDGDSFDMTLAGGTKQQVKFPANTITRIQFAPPKDPDPDAPALNLTNGDKLVGQLTGQLKLDTSFDTLTINGPEVKRLAHPDPTALDVQLTLWDDSTLSGQLRQPDLPVRLNSGVTLSIPSALVADYTQPTPSPSPATTEKIKTLVTALSADDFKQREQAQTDLLSMGPAVLRPLRDLKPSQSPEAQQRIDSILKQLDKRPDKSPAPPRQ